MNKLENKHLWQLHNDGQEFLCKKCGETYDRTRSTPFPSDDGCEGDE